MSKTSKISIGNKKTYNFLIFFVFYLHKMKYGDIILYYNFERVKFL